MDSPRPFHVDKINGDKWSRKAWQSCVYFLRFMRMKQEVKKIVRSWADPESTFLLLHNRLPGNCGWVSEDSRDGSLNFFKKLFQSPAEHEKKIKIDKNRAGKGVINAAGSVNMTHAMTMKKSFAACFIKPRCNLNAKHQLNKCKHTWNNDNIFIKSSLSSRLSPLSSLWKKGFSIKSLHDGI